MEPWVFLLDSFPFPFLVFSFPLPLDSVDSSSLPLPLRTGSFAQGGEGRRWHENLLPLDTTILQDGLHSLQAPSEACAHPGSVWGTWGTSEERSMEPYGKKRGGSVRAGGNVPSSNLVSFAGNLPLTFRSEEAVMAPPSTPLFSLFHPPSLQCLFSNVSLHLPLIPPATLFSSFPPFLPPSLLPHHQAQVNGERVNSVEKERKE